MHIFKPPTLHTSGAEMHIQIYKDGRYQMLTPFLPVWDSNWGIQYDKMHEKPRSMHDMYVFVFSVLSPRIWITLITDLWLTMPLHVAV